MNKKELTTLFGLEVIAIFEYYDRPLLLAYQDKAGNLFLVVLIDETAGGDMWLYSPVSESRLERIKAAEIDLHDAFSDVEGGKLYRVYVPSDKIVPNIESVMAADVLDSDLPEKGCLISQRFDDIPF